MSGNASDLVAYFYDITKLLFGRGVFDEAYGFVYGADFVGNR